MRHFPLLPACVLLLFLAPLTRTGGAVRADELSFAGGPPAPRPTLAQALAALEPPKQDLFLTVGADKVLLPPGEPPPDPTDRPGTVGAAYGRLARDFGGVMALAPPTMMVLNTHLGVPDPYAGLPAEDALKLLLHRTRSRRCWNGSPMRCRRAVSSTPRMSGLLMLSGWLTRSSTPCRVPRLRSQSSWPTVSGGRRLSRLRSSRVRSV